MAGRARGDWSRVTLLRLGRSGATLLRLAGVAGRARGDWSRVTLLRLGRSGATLLRLAGVAGRARGDWSRVTLLRLGRSGATLLQDTSGPRPHRRSAANGGWLRSFSDRIASASPIGHSMPSAGSNAWISVYSALGDQWALTR